MTQPSKELLNELADKWLKGTLTPQEKELLDKWYDLDSQEPIQWTGKDDSEDILSERLLRNIQKRKQLGYLLKRKWQMAAAAVLLITLSITTYIYFNRAGIAPRQKRVSAAIKPGGNKAFLIFANGKRISLTDALKGKVAKQAGVLVIKAADGQVVYHVTEADSSIISYNTIETPKGGQYRVELADGTIVWLNAASSLTFPNHFTGANRMVKLTGEAYFEVAKDKAHPFLVKSRLQTIQVLGTHFNVNAYNDEAVVKSTLLEGSVKITADVSGKTVFLKPGEQSRLSAAKLFVGEANTTEAIAWKNGYFRFDDEKIESIMRKISRWYDVDVVYQGDVTQEGFVGAITSFSNINDVLDIMQRSKAVHFKIEGRRIIVEK